MTGRKLYTGIILAAGFSSRMKKWKHGIILDELPLILHTVMSVSKSCSEIVIVGGYNIQGIKTALDGQDKVFFAGTRVILTKNRNFSEGMFSSVKAGLSKINPKSNGVFIIPGDMPFVQNETFEILIRKLENDSDFNVFIPLVMKENFLKKGHPVLIKREIIEDILAENNTMILRDVLKKFNVKTIETSDTGICFDIDTDEDLQLAERYLEFNRNNNDKLKD